jgi:Putative beta-barrel porin-2, OmpL-like. bbp2
VLRLVCAATYIGCLLLASSAPAQTTDPAPAANGSADGPSEWSVGPITFSGLIDGYYDVNFNHPESGINALRNFDVKANQFSLNMAKVTLEHTPDPLGFRLDLGFGRAFDIIHSGEQEPSVFRNIEQVFVSFKPKQAKGLEVDFGKFVTSAGAEVIETKDNWNYSRSLLFSWAIPYYHFGVRASMPLNKYFTAGVQLVNGWNNVEDNNNGKTVGVTGALTVGKVTWSTNYYTGPEKADLDHGSRHLFDTTVLLAATPKLSTYVNYDYGVDKNAGAGEKRWTGIACAGRYTFNSWFAVAPRIEWFNDADGFMTGTTQKVKELTMTAEFKAKEGVLTRLEYRHDWSNAEVFDRGAFPSSWKNQDTILVGFVAYFGPKR